MPEISIQATGKSDGSRIYLDGADISDAVRSVTWRHSVHTSPIAEVELMVVEGAMVSGEVEWYGLEQVPTEALRAEIDRRGAE